MNGSSLFLEILVEEPSMEQVLGHIIPKVVPQIPFAVRTFQGKAALKTKLPVRMRAYAAWIPTTATKVVVLVDQDDEDCAALKSELERAATDAGLTTRSSASVPIHVMNRIVVRELESWFFGDVPALRSVYPRVSASLDSQQRYRDTDAIPQAWESLERLLQRRGYHRAGLPKLKVATEIATHMDVEKNRSRSFQAFRDGLRRLVNEENHAEAD